MHLSRDIAVRGNSMNIVADNLTSTVNNVAQNIGMLSKESSNMKESRPWFDRECKQLKKLLNNKLTQCIES